MFARFALSILLIFAIAPLTMHIAFAQDPEEPEEPTIEQQYEVESIDPSKIMKTQTDALGLNHCVGIRNQALGMREQAGVNKSYEYTSCTIRQVVNAIANIAVYVAVFCLIWGGGMMALSPVMGEQARSTGLSILKATGVGLFVVLFSYALANLLAIGDAQLF